MKKDLINNYTIFMIIIFIIENIILINLKIKGIVYEIFMLILVILNMIILIKYNREIKFKILTIIVSLFLFLLSKDFYNAIFMITNILTLLIITIFNAIKKQSLKTIILSILAVIFLFKYFFYIILFIMFVLYNKLTYEEDSDIYYDTYYYCENNYEAYVYSAGAFDSFHYSVGKHYEIFNIDGIINVSYRERNETTKENYEEFIRNNKCTLVGDIDGFK